MIKVCGMREAENIREVEALGVDLMGFIFWPKSSRYVSERPAYMPTRCQRVGVFVNEEAEQVKHTTDDFSLNIIQLHGSELPDYVQRLRLVCGDNITIIKAFNIATTVDLEATKTYEGIVDYFLFDTKGKCVGGNGEKFDWRVLDDYVGETLFLLSGGIGPDDVERVKAWHHPKCMGIDLNSRFEIAPGLKDVTALARFLHEIQ